MAVSHNCFMNNNDDLHKAQTLPIKLCQLLRRTESLLTDALTDQQNNC